MLYSWVSLSIFPSPNRSNKAHRRNKDVSMPIMGGYESTRHIRTIETERRLAYARQNTLSTPFSLATSPRTSFPFHKHSPSNETSPSAFNHGEPPLKLNPPALIIALTGFSSENDQKLAFKAGMDIFMTKPVRFKEVGKILDGWMKSRERRERDEKEKLKKEKVEK